MKRILVTGGAGFVGSHLCKRLINEGHYVICLDNLYTGSKKKIDSLIENENFEFIQHDICQAIDLEVDEIYNLACPASPPHYQADPIFTLNTSVLGIINTLEIAKKNKAKILQASTSEVYGDPQVHPQNESYWGHVNPVGIRSCYDEGKRIAETYMIEYQRKFGVEIKIIRIFNTYGPHMNPEDGRVVSNFIMQALRGEDITIYGKGDQTRSFCFVDDLVEGIVRLMNTDSSFSGPCNVGNPGEFTILELAQKVTSLIDTKSKLIYKDLPKDDPMQRKPDISLAMEKLNWQPTIELEEGLKKSIEYFRTCL